MTVNNFYDFSRLMSDIGRVYNQYHTFTINGIAGTLEIRNTDTTSKLNEIILTVYAECGMFETFTEIECNVNDIDYTIQRKFLDIICNLREAHEIVGKG